MIRSLLSLFFFFIFFNSFAQLYKVDSLNAVLKTATADTVKIQTYDALGITCSPSDLAASLQYFRNALELENNPAYKKLKAKTLRRMGNAYFHNLIYEKAMNYYLQSLKIATELGDKSGMAGCYNNIGNIFSRQGDLTGDRNDFLKAIDYHEKSIALRKEIGDYDNVNNSRLNIGNAYVGLGQYEKALENYLVVLQNYERRNDPNGIDLCRINIGETYLALANKNHNTDDYKKAKEFFEERIKSYGDGNGDRKSQLLKNMGEISLRTGDNTGALSYLTAAIEMAKITHTTETEKDAAQLLSELFQKMGDFKKAFEYSQLNDALKDSLLNQQKAADMTRMQIAFDTEEKEAQIKSLETEKKIGDLENAKAKADVERQRIIIISSMAALLLLGVFAFLLFNRYKLKQKANEKISAAYDIIEKKNIQITDSITYAKRIQDSILPSEDELKSYFPESFIFFQPRDIVSGDFYWFSQRKEKIFMAVADCTGHGVPGAFMSMIGNTLLNEIVNEKGIYDPAEILSQLDEGVSAALSHGKNDRQMQEDGMDISLCVIDKAKMEIEFSAANHFLYLFRNGQAEIIPGDIYSIGGMFGKKGKAFLKRKITVEKNTMLFMSTDGYQDQFGGSMNKKFMSGKFEELLGKNANENSENQKKNISGAFYAWKGENKQLDDVLVLGFRI